MSFNIFPYLSELLGTFLLMLSILMTHANPLAVGATLGIVVFLGGRMKIHVNPAVSITFFLYNKINAFMTIGFIASQIAGAVLSLYVFRMFA